MTMMDLPMSLIMDILSRIPAKSLLQFRCVSKSWKYIIDDTHFTKLQLQHSLQNITDHALVIQGDALYSVDFPALDKAIAIDHPFNFNSIGADLLGCCDGLLCLSKGEGRGRGGAIIYNPTTKKSRELPASRIEFPEYGTWCEGLVYGFGYDLASDDYKVVRIIQFYSSRPDTYDSEVKVFSLKTSSWRRVHDFPHEYFLSYKRQRGVYVSGYLHWMVTVKPKSDGSKLIVAFDLKAEEFKVVPQPKYSPGVVHLNVEVLQQRLCVLVNYPTIRSEVWIMKEYGNQESWVELFTILQRHVIGPFVYVRPIALSKDGSKVLLEQDDEKFIWFDLQRQKVERVMIRGLRLIDKSYSNFMISNGNAPSHPEIAVLVESLVFGSCKTHQKKKRCSKEKERLENVKVAVLPNTSKSEAISGSPLDPGNVTGNHKTKQRRLRKAII